MMEGIPMLRHAFAFLTGFLLGVAGPVFAEEKPLLGTLPEDFTVHAVGTSRGTSSLNVQLDDSGHDTTQVEVVVNKPKQTLVLVLTAYNPVVWRVGRTKDTKIAGILVSGYHGQALIGIDKEIPHAISSNEIKGDFEYFFAYGASPRLLQMNKAIHKLVGREIHRFHFKPSNGVFHIGDPPARKEDILYSQDLKIEDYARPGQKMAGQKALDRLVVEGKLRHATMEDIEAWVDKASEKYKRFNPELRVETRMHLGDTYVVLGEVELPNGLFGGHSRDFIIPQGVPFPAGPECHNTFYMMNGTARGAGADH